MIPHVELFLCKAKQETPEEGQKKQQLKCCVSTYHKDEDNSLKNCNQNNNLILTSIFFHRNSLGSSSYNHKEEHGSKIIKDKLSIHTITHYLV